jgi:hypothetical protein
MLLHPPFPRPSSGFVGRSEERRRVAELLSSEVLYLVYGIAGIGKSEFVYQAIEDARGTPRFSGASAVFAKALFGQSLGEFVAQLRSRLSADKRELGAAPQSLEQECAAVARLLEDPARPVLLFLDDLHHLHGELDGKKDGAGALLGYLGRHVRASRIFAASRTELKLPAGSLTPVFIRLQPFDEETASEYIFSLSRRIGKSGVDAAEVFRSSGGSPVMIRRELTRKHYLVDDEEESPAETLLGLSSEARQVLLLARLLRGRLQVVKNATKEKEAVHELGRRFLIDIERGGVIVHDLVWETLLPMWPAEDLLCTRRLVADELLRRFELDPRRSASDGCEAVRQLILAEDRDRAFSVLKKIYRPIAAAGHDHLVLELLPALRAGPLSQRIELELFSARIFLRRAEIKKAQEILDTLGQQAAVARLPAFLRLCAEVCQRSGRLDEARHLFTQAGEALKDGAENPRARFFIALELASIHALQGQSERAQQLLLSARAERQKDEADALSPLEEARWGLAEALRLLLADRVEDAASIAARVKSLFLCECLTREHRAPVVHAAAA